MNDRTVTVFGGTGFLGRRVVRHLRKSGFPVRIASRRLERAKTLFDSDNPQLQSVKADIHNERSIAGACAAVNAVSLYVEHGQETFQSAEIQHPAQDHLILRFTPTGWNLRQAQVDRCRSDDGRRAHCRCG